MWFLEIQLREGSPTFDKVSKLIVIRSERTQIHFLSDIFTAVASLDRKVPYAEKKKAQLPILP